MSVVVRRYRSREAWLGARRIGSSDVATILGVGASDEDEPRRSPWDVWLRLRGETRRDRWTPDAERGRRLEPVVLRRYARETGRDVRAVPPHTMWVRDEWASATPDGLDRDGVIEAKTDRNPWRWGPATTIDRWGPWALEHVRPDHYLQVAHQLFVLDRPVGHLAVLLPGARDPFEPELRVYRIERDRELEERLVDRLARWYEAHVLDGEPLELDGSEAAGYALAQTAASGGSRRATAEEDALARTYVLARQAEQHWHDTRVLAGQHLVEHAHGISRLDLPTGHVTVVRNRGRRTLDERRLLADHPELGPVLDQYRVDGDPYVYPRISGMEVQWSSNGK